MKFTEQHYLDPDTEEVLRQIKTDLNKITEETITITIAAKATTTRTANRRSVNRPLYWTLTIIQATLAVTLSHVTNKRWLKHKLAYLMEKIPANWLSLLMNARNTPISGVYFLMSTNTKADYVGETGNMNTRFFQEFLAARKIERMKQHNTHAKYSSSLNGTKAKASKCIMTMASVGPHNWFMLPLFLVDPDITNYYGKDVSRATRRRAERLYIRSLNPTMNTMHTHRHKRDEKKRKKRNRPPIHIRKRRNTCEQHHQPLSLCNHTCHMKQRTDPIPKLTTYTILATNSNMEQTITTTYTLDIFLASQKPNTHLKIYTNQEKADLTNKNNLLLYHKDMSGPNGHLLFNTLRKNPNGFRITTTGTNYEEFLHKKIQKISNKAHAWQRTLPEGNNHDTLRPTL